MYQGRFFSFSDLIHSFTFYAQRPDYSAIQYISQGPNVNVTISTWNWQMKRFTFDRWMGLGQTAVFLEELCSVCFVFREMPRVLGNGARALPTDMITFPVLAKSTVVKRIKQGLSRCVSSIVGYLSFWCPQNINLYFLTTLLYQPLKPQSLQPWTVAEWHCTPSTPPCNPPLPHRRSKNI